MKTLTKKTAVILACILFFTAIPTIPANAADRRPQKTVKILLIGNSYTGYNNLDQILEKICKRAGRKASVTSIAEDGAALYHYADTDTFPGRLVRSLLLNQSWDYVVLQDRHYYPVKFPYRTKSALQSLKPYVKASGARMFLFMTWVPEKGHSDYTNLQDLVAGRKDYQKLTADSCTRIGKDCGATVIPIGLSFFQSIKYYPGINLIIKDKSHPTIAGSYLSACTIYTTLFHEPLDIAYSAGLRPSTAKALQKVAWNTSLNYRKNNSLL